MTDLVSDTPPVAQSPKRKFSFRFPNLSNHGTVGSDKDNNIGNGIASNTNILSNTNRTRNFTEEINNVPDLQVSNLIIFNKIFFIVYLNCISI